MTRDPRTIPPKPEDTEGAFSGSGVVGLWRRLPFPLQVFLVSRLVYWIPGAIGRALVAPFRHFPPPGHAYFHGAVPYKNFLIELFVKWDSYWFLNVAREGYHWHGLTMQVSEVISVPESNVTVFPLLPLLIRFLSLGVLDHAIVGLLICNAALLAAFFALHRLALRQLDPPAARRFLWYFSLYPIAFVYSSIYSDSLYILFAALAILFMEDRRYLAAGIAGLLLTTSRLPGAVILPVFAIMALQRWRRGPAGSPLAALPLILAPLGALAFFWHLRNIGGSWTLYFEGQKAWGKAGALPWKAMIDELSTALRKPEEYAHMINALFIFPIVGFTLFAIWKEPLHLATFWGLGLLLALSSTSLVGFPRYAGALFPMFIPLARLGAAPRAHRAILAAFLLAGLASVVGWTNWFLSY